jgi:HK97 family phage major capsid protein
MTIREILQRRDAIRTDLRGILDQYKDGNLPDEARSRADELEAEAGRLNDAERRQVLVDELDRRAAGVPLTGTGDAGFETAAREVTILDALRAAAGGQDPAARRALEVSQEIARRTGRQPNGIYWDFRASSTYAREAYERRVFGTLTPAAGPGGALVATTVSQVPIDLLSPKLIVARLGATVMSGLVGNLAIPRVKQWPTVFWVTENQPLTVTDPATEQVVMSPHHCGAVTELTRQLMMQSSPDAVRLVENILAGAVAQAIDQVALVGGAAGQPSGILAPGSGVPVVAIGANGGAPTWNSLVAAVASVDQSNALQGRLGWAGNAKTTSVLARTLRTTTDTASNFILDDPNTLLGYPYLASQNVPSSGTKGTGTNLSALIFGDWSALVIGYWSALDLAINTQGDAVFLKGNAQIRVMATLDLAIQHPLAFAAITDIVTT